MPFLAMALSFQKTERTAQVIVWRFGPSITPASSSRRPMLADRVTSAGTRDIDRCCSLNIASHRQMLDYRAPGHVVWPMTVIADRKVCSLHPT
jgi:hypothetical protein